VADESGGLDVWDHARAWHARAPRLSAAFLAVTAVALAHGWPLLDGSGGGGADAITRAVAALAASLVAAGRATQADGAARLAWGAAVAGALGVAVLAVADLVALGRDGAVVAPTLVAYVALGVAVLLGAAVYVLVARASGPPARRAVELALSIGVVAPVVAAAGAAFDVVPTDAVLVRVLGAVVLLGVAVHGLAVWFTPHDAGRWPLLPLALLPLGLGELLAAADLAPARLTGAGTALAMLLLIAGALTGPVVGSRLEVSRELPRWVLPLLVLVTAPVAGALLTVVRPTSATLRPLALGVLAVLVLLLARAQLLLVEQRAQLAELGEERTAFEHRAFHDDLTQLANRALFLNRLQHALELHRRHHRPLTVLFGDLDAFKAVNDRHGHHVGDELLCAVADRLRGTIRPADTLARLSGDEFAVLLEEDTDAGTVSRRIEAELASPFPSSAGPLSARMSVGMARVAADDPTPTATELLRRADEQMFRRKGERAVARGAVPGRSLASALPAALDEGAITVDYQPLVDLATGRVVGVEALARWQHEGQAVPPMAFVAVARELGLLPRLTALVADRACEQLRQWCDRLGHDRLTVSINVEGEQLTDAALRDRLVDVRDRHGLRPGQLLLEVPASAVAGDEAVAISRELLAAGLPLSVSGLAEDGALVLLQRLPVASVKLPDGVVTAGGRVTEERLLRALAGAGRELDAQIVVEGVERHEDVPLLREVGGLLAQGYALCRPAPPADLETMISEGLKVG
jgi:diguanylate cyclase